VGGASISLCQSLRFQHLTPEDGLSNGRHWSKKCILRDNFGIIWISTVDGLNRWDGYDVEVFKNDVFDTTSIHSNFVTGMSQAQDGDIYIGTADNGVVRYNYETGIFTDIGVRDIINSTPQINHVQCDGNGVVWVGSAFGGVIKYVIEKDTLIKVPLFRDEMRSSWSEGTVNSMILEDGTIVFAGYYGLHFLDAEQDTFHHVNTGDYNLHSIEEAKDGRIWAGDYSWDGVLIVDRSTEEYEIMKVEGGGLGMSGIKRDNDGNMWLSRSNIGNEQLIKYDFDSGDFSFYPYDPDNEQSFTKAVAIETTFDSLNRMWYMSSSKGAGFTRIEEPFFEKLWDIPTNNILFKNDSTIILIDEYNVFEMNLNTQESNRFYDYGREYGRRPSLIDDKRNLWTYDAGLGYFDIVNIETKNHKTFKTKFVEDIENDADKIWTSKMLEYIDTEKLEIVSINQNLKKKDRDTINWSVTYELEVLNDGTVMLATASEGFYLYNPKDTTLLHYDGKEFEPGKLSSSRLTYIYESEYTNTIYIATSENFNIWNRDEDTFSYINQSDGLEGKVLSMIEDDERNLWILTSQGMHKIKDHKVIARYGQSYNLHGMVDRIDPFMVKDKHGHIYFNNSKALYRFHPSSFDRMRPPSDILIQNLFLRRAKQNPTQSNVINENLLLKPKLVFDYADRDIGFGFVSPFEADRDVEYYYKLEGYDDQWINNGLVRHVHFTNLDNGDYTFLVKGKSIDGMDTINVSEIDFTIRAPWYKRWWAYLLFTLLVMSLFYGLFRYRLYQITRYQVLRTKISSDLHDDVGTLLSSLAMQSDVLGLDAPPEKIDKFEKFSSLSREAMDRMRDTVWAIDSNKDNLVSLVDRMNDYISDMYDDHRIDVNFEPNKSKLNAKIAPDIRQNVYLIFKEAINNAMKYSDGDRVDVLLDISTKEILLSIKDNGSKVKMKSSGLGIQNMQMRAKKIKGKMDILTEDGFEVRLVV